MELVDTGVAAAEVGEDTDGELNVGTALLLDAIRDEVLRRDVVATRGFVETRVLGVVENNVPGMEGAKVVSPEDKFASQSARVLPLRQQPKVVQ